MEVRQPTSEEQGLKKAAGQAVRHFLEMLGQLRSSSLTNKVAESYIVRLASVALGLMANIIIARALGPEGRGEFVFAMTIVAMATQFGNLGLHAANTYYVARHPNQLKYLLGNSTVVSVLLGLIAGAIVSFVSFRYPSVVELGGMKLVFTLLLIPLGLELLLNQTLIIGLERIRTFNKLEITNRVLAVGGLGGLLLTGGVSVEAVLAVYVLATLATVTIAFRDLLKHIEGVIRTSQKLFIGTLGYGLRAYFAALFGFLVLKFDILMVQYFLGPKETGYYSIATSMADMLLLFATVVGMVMFPRLSSLETDKERYQLARKAAYVVAFLVGGVAILIWPLSKWLIGILFGEEFSPAAEPFVWLLSGIVFMSVNTILMNYFASLGMPVITIVSPLLAMLLNVALNTYLIPLYGISGSAIASSVAYGSMFIFSIAYMLYTGGREKVSPC